MTLKPIREFVVRFLKCFRADTACESQKSSQTLNSDLEGLKTLDLLLLPISSNFRDQVGPKGFLSAIEVSFLCGSQVIIFTIQF